MLILFAVMFVVLTGLIYYLMMIGVGGGNQVQIGNVGGRVGSVRRRPNDQMKPFYYHTFRQQDKVKFVIDFSGLGRYPFLRGRPTETAEDTLFQRIGAAILRGYDYTIISLREKLSRNGRAYKDDAHPVRLDIKFVASNRQSFKTSILIYHTNLYGYCFRVLGVWMCFGDSPYFLLDRASNIMGIIEFDSGYMHNCYDSVGLSTITKSLRDLNSENSRQSLWKRSVLHLCFCFIEAARFPEIYRLVRLSLLKSLATEDSFYIKERVDVYYHDLIHHWGILSRALTALEDTHVWSIPESAQNMLQIHGNDGQQIARVRSMVAVRL